MSAFDSDIGPESYSGEQEARRCKPDYEKLIKIQKDKNTVSTNLKNAVFDYLDVWSSYSRKNPEFTLPSLIGSLELEIRYGEVAIEKLIKQQEQDKD